MCRAVRNFSAHEAESGNDMRNYDIASPNAAERYFNYSIFGQLYTLIAKALGGGRQDRPRRNGRAATRSAPPVATGETPRPALLDRMDAWFWRQLQNDREAYLARSRDVFDLERRIEALERGAIVRYY